MSEKKYDNWQIPTSEDLQVVEEQIGRAPRDVVGIAARCRCGKPTVVVTAARLSDGTPFPTVFYLTHPQAVKAASRLEATGIMEEFNRQLNADPAMKAAYEQAHLHYLAARAPLGEVPEIANVSAGGMPTRVKCLHALVGHALAAGPGVNPVGDAALAMMEKYWSAQTCNCASDSCRVGAIDCGTNTIRLLVADVNTSEHGVVVKDVVRTMEIVRLGEGVDKNREFSAQALTRTFAAVDKIRELCAEHQVEKLRFVATSASRDVSNRQEFIDGVYQRLRCYPEVISGQEEAHLSFAGALSALDSRLTGNTLVVDVGGGSSELALGDPVTGKVAQSFSMNVGSVRMWERYLRDAESARERGESNSGRWLQMVQQQVRVEVGRALDEAERHVDLTKVCSMVGVAGTVTSVTAAHLGLSRYDSAAIHGQQLTVSEIRRACQSLADMTLAERADLGFISPGRLEVIGAGALIWCEIVRRVAASSPSLATRIWTSEHDILDGIAISMLK